MVQPRSKAPDLGRVTLGGTPRPATILSTATDPVIRAILPIGFCALCLLIGNAAIATVSAALEAEQVEICHRAGGTPETCGALPH